MSTVAGHSWTDTPAGRACATCPMTRRQLHAATEEAIGQQGWAHVGALNATEYREICEDREAALGEREAIWAAVVSVGSGR